MHTSTDTVNVTRRSVLATSSAAAAALLCPAYVRNAFSSSGELNILAWSDAFPDPIIPNFEKATGIRVNFLRFTQNEEQLYKLRAITAEQPYDLCQPALSRASQFKDLNILAPFEMSKLTNVSAIIPSILRGSETYWT
ncbi:hypothetical protein MYG64_33630 (plasmid) [Ensifer adhaerens]|uniref:hypothetical protein n=1 Tax=Ensifer adhaerens TaxID=106592 RepID=UPI002100A300|nr:hypothetical protein [Ensifer adhaerens]UTV40732.1 hypothetical protein MYG64_33630 [Ensifer adhaerens]